MQIDLTREEINDLIRAIEQVDTYDTLFLKRLRPLGEKLVRYSDQALKEPQE